METNCVFLALADILHKKNYCSWTLGGLSSVSTKLEQARFKSNQILQINLLQKFSPYCLCQQNLILQIVIIFLESKEM